ncbi:MAG: hypothetical protein MUE33_08805 [Cytophagaceae bacterium]|nr:hypothetical protein [Cytophagaceae bacterium]
MIPKRIKLWMSLFTVSLIGAVGVLWNNSSKTSPVFDGFIAVDTMDIQEIQYSYNGKKHIIDVVSDNEWRVDGKYILRPDVVQLIKIGLGRMEPKMFVTKEEIRIVEQSLIKDGVKISIVGEQQTVEYTIGPNSNDPNSTWYQSNKSPLVIHVPGFTGDYSKIFRMNIQDLRDPYIFTSSVMSLQELEVSYKDQPKYGFVIRNQNGLLVLEGASRVDSSKLYAYTQLYGQVGVHGYVVDKERDSVERMLVGEKPEVRIRLKDREIRRSNTLLIYKALPGDKYLYGKIEEKDDLVRLNPKILQYLLVRKDIFMDK